MKRLFFALAFGTMSAVLSIASDAHAIVINTTTATPNDWVGSFGAPNPATAGQTFVAPQSHLDSFSLYLDFHYQLTAGVDPTLDLRGYIAAWDGTKATEILYASDTRTMNGVNVLQEFAFAPDLSLVPGQQYVAFLSISALPPQVSAPAVNRFYIPYRNDFVNAYAGGQWVSMNNGTNFSLLTSSPWDQLPGDIWFKASFSDEPSSVPLPAALPLFATGLGVVMLLARRKRSKAQWTA